MLLVIVDVNTYIDATAGPFFPYENFSLFKMEQAKYIHIPMKK